MRALQCLSLAFLFLANPVPSKAQAAAATTDATPAGEPEATRSAGNVIVFDLGSRFSLNCSQLLPNEYDAVFWKKNDTEVDKVWDLAGRYELKDNVFQMTARSNEDDFGNYTCGKRGVNGDAGAWQVQLRPHAKLPANTNVVEGQKLKLQCKLAGKPYPPVTWTFSNSSDNTNATDVTVVLAGRVKLQASEQGVENAELVVEAAERSDAGVFTCTPRGGLSDTTTLRVKDMYAALWPFLGICIEVFILCAIILVYEKRRTKPELDDSDTDNHDQKKS